jgi:uncharacterized iron-regulated membrane protein
MGNLRRARDSRALRGTHPLSMMNTRLTTWQQWKNRPQSVWLRRAVFQVHLWSGIGIGLYVFVISLTGSIVVYRNELYAAAERAPIVLTPSGPRLTDADLKAVASRGYPGYAVTGIGDSGNARQAVRITLAADSSVKERLFNPYTGEDLGEATTRFYRFVTWLLSLHDDLLGGETGRSVNGAGALLVIVLALTGIVVWWPGVRSWRRSLMVRRHVGWRRFIWDLHSMVGFWTLGIILMFAISGAYLCFPESFQAIADRVQPLTTENATSRIVDKVLYWLAYLHVGRVYGIALPCQGPGLCDQSTKLAWAFFGLAPAVMFVTGAVMWWNRVVRSSVRRARRLPEYRELEPLTPASLE